MAKNKIYKTASGQEVDMEQLMLKNEKVRAVGNMNVNARGDVIDSSNDTTSARAAQVNKNYRKQIGNVAQDLPVATSKKAEEAKAAEAITGLDEVPVKKAKTKKVAEVAEVEEADATEESGLAGAIAKANKKTKKSK